MTSLLDVVQESAVDALGNDRGVRLEALRPALRSLRASYSAGEAPDFSDPSVRAAYVFAYHPHHCAMAVEALTAVGVDLLGVRGKPTIRVVVLGAGPAPELVALTWILRGAGVSIDVHLVDREPGWRRTRATTIDSTIPRWCSDPLTVTHHIADLSTTQGLAAISPLLHEADLVLAQAVITELPNPLEDGKLIDHVVDTFGSTTRLLAIDFDRVRGYRGVNERVDGARNAVLVTTARFDLPAASPPRLLAEHLYDSSDGLRPRRKLHCALRLLARPGALADIAVDSVTPTPSQRAALDAFSSFLRGPERVFVLRGAAGTGKTTLFPALIECAAQWGMPVVLLAPTGQAARRLKIHTGRPGSTLHSHVYRFAETAALDDDDEQPMVTRFVPREPPIEPAVYIVDEASLVGDATQSDEDARVAEVLFGEGRLLADTLAACLHADGSRVVFVGDMHQLPPVGEDTSPALDPGYLTQLTGSGVAVATLDEVMRQAEGSGVLALAHDWLLAGSTPAACRHDPEAGVVVTKGRPTIDGWLEQELLDGGAVVIAARNADVRHWNQRIRAAAGRTSSTPVVGEKLFVLRTDPLTGLVNGDELTLVAIDDAVATLRLRGDEVRLRAAVVRLDTAAGPIDFNAEMVDDLLLGATPADHRRVTLVLHVDFVQRTGLRPGKNGFTDAYMNDGRVHALRVAYGYARTCHRAQGGEWPNVVVDFAGSRAFHHAGRWAYTALTRAQRAVHLLHVGEASFDIERLVAGAAQRLQQVDLVVADQREIQHGVQLIVSTPAGDRVAVDLYLKGGVPSSAVPSGPDRNGLQRRAVDALKGWAAEQRAGLLPSLPPEVVELAGRLATTLSVDGYDLVAEQRAAYQLALTVTSVGGSATIVYNFKSSGHLSSERSASADGDLALIDVLRSAVKHACV